MPIFWEEKFFFAIRFRQTILFCAKNIFSLHLVTIATASVNPGSNYAPNLKEVEGAYWFRVVRPSMHLFLTLFDACHILWIVLARVLKFQIWILHGKIADTHFFSCPSFLPFWIPLWKKNRMKSDACHILWTVHARVLKFHIWIPHGKIANPYIFFRLIYLPFWSFAPLNKSEWNLASKIPLGQLIEDDG